MFSTLKQISDSLLLLVHKEAWAPATEEYLILLRYLLLMIGKVSLGNTCIYSALTKHRKTGGHVIDVTQPRNPLPSRYHNCV